ncbi:AfsR/SARP family transcriptional regulator [Kribbella flavida]|uniref:AfsR/SARP family transcriptional regulator n=1 Tax=Kribbella flavida TaxID=182640 RepID=UPI001ED94F01|nr:BTAD domain-containing putative transcriptional regulator [Kribbella flavida]
MRFGELLAAVPLEPDPGGQRRLLAEALQLWRGAPFEGVGSQWLDEVESTRMVELYVSAREHWVDLDLAAGRHDAAVAELREVTARYPLREALWSRLLLALRLSGRQAEALACYEEVRVLLADQLGVDPGPELKRQYSELLHSGQPAPAPDSGSSAAAEDNTPAPDHPPAAVPRQLPAARGVFVGRGRELRVMDELFDSAADEPAEPEMIVLHGLGGIGKTALALHWVHSVRERFPDGQLFIDLQGYGPGEPVDPASALHSLLVGVGLPEAQIPDDVEARSSMLRTMLADRQALLVLDNALNADQVRPLIPGPGSLSVVTSRNELHGLAVREGADRIALDELTSAESKALLRARLATQDVGDNLLAELANLCGHVPLALSIAAERSGSAPEAQITALIDELRTRHHPLAALAVGDESGDLRAVFARSYQALGPRAAQAFRVLGRHLGSQFGLPAAAALLGTTPYDAVPVLESLADQHLLSRVDGRRFEFHDLVRAYAVELAHHDGPPTARDRAARNVLPLATRSPATY